MDAAPESESSSDSDNMDKEDLGSLNSKNSSIGRDERITKLKESTRDAISRMEQIMELNMEKIMNLFIKMNNEDKVISTPVPSTTSSNSEVPFLCLHQYHQDL